MSDYTNEQYAALYAKMHATMRTIGGVGKSGYNEFQKYSYAANEDIVNAVREALLANGLMFAVSMRSCELQEIILREKSGANEKEKLTTRALVNMDMTLMDIETGATITFPFSNAALDTGDKAVNKAITAAKKYWLISTFLIDTDTDDSDSQHVQQPASKPTTHHANQRNGSTPHAASQNAPTPSSASNSGKFNWKQAAWWKRAVDTLFDEFEIEREHAANLLNKWAKEGHLAQDMSEQQALISARTRATHLLSS